ncbi:MAG: hypothetical protein CSA33_07885 [Desulfobulbus propionicus]|nr:MAG: hypothetical protein CSA33_07885 [Desulfobulbus propionicus]
MCPGNNESAGKRKTDKFFCISIILPEAVMWWAIFSAISRDTYRPMDMPGMISLITAKTFSISGALSMPRKKFADIIKAQGKKAKPGSAHKGLAFFSNLYKIEKRCRDEDHTPEEIYQRRQGYSQPILDHWKSWLEKKKQLVPSKTALGKAVTYTVKRWHRLIGYLADGRLAPDKNDLSLVTEAVQSIESISKLI